MEERPRENAGAGEVDDRSLPPRAGVSERLDAAMLALDAWRERPGVIAGGSLAVVVVVAMGWWLGRPAPARPVEELIPQVRLETTVQATTQSSPVVVHVAGAVNAPGVYTLAAGSRVEHAIVAAGGALAAADLDQLNLAAPLPDGVQIRVPVVGEVLPAAPSLSGPDRSAPIDINRAGADQFESLPGIGPATAAAIVAWRDEHGPFRSVEGLLDVPGIGPAKLAGLADLAVVG